MSPAPGASPAVRLFAELYADYDGAIELRALPSASREFVHRAVMSEALARFVQEHHAEDLYFGVAVRRRPQAEQAPRGALMDCIALPALFIDLDFKATAVEHARDALRRFPLKPSAAVRSGGGVHLYWFLKEPMELPVGAPSARDFLRRIARHLGGDLSAAEPARILRIPGTLNRKYAPPRPVVLAQFDATRRFNPSDFDLLPPDPEDAGGSPRFVLPEQIHAGGRNAALYGLARSLKGRGLSEPEIFVTLNEVNKVRCRPPLDQQEVRAIAHHAVVQGDRPRDRHVEVL